MVGAVEMERAHESRRFAWMPWAVWAVATAYLFWRAPRGWIPHDEGTLGQAGLRVLGGELPHRDFDELYTGGLSFLHAAVFRVAGVDLVHLRLLLAGVASLTLAGVQSIASRFASPLAVSGIGVAALAWSFPNYFAALPSWYNATFAVAGTWALLRFDETGRRAWLSVAGTAAGASFCFKSVGLGLAAAGLLFLVYREQDEARTATDRAGLSRAVTVVGCGAFVLALAGLIASRPAVMEALHFFLPGALLAAVVVRREKNGLRLTRFLRDVVPFGLGVAAPVALLFGVYAASGGLAALLDGVFVAPRSRFRFASDPLPPPWTLVAAVLPALLLVIPYVPVLRKRAGLLALAAGAGSLAVLTLGATVPVYRAVWFGVRPLLPLAVTIGAYRLLSREAQDPAPARRRLFLILAVAALTGLLQFPFAFGVYFCYASLSLILAVACLVSMSGARVPAAVLGVGLALFPFVWMHRADFRQLGVHYRPIEAGTPLGLPRAGLRVQQGWSEIYREVIGEVERRSSPGDAILALPDSPEIYFLAGRRNPTRTFFDFVDPDATGAEVLARLFERERVPVVVLNRATRFSGEVTPAVARLIRSRYPEHRVIGHFVVAWRAEEGR